MNKDPREVWSDTFYEAIEDNGLDPDAAVKVAEEAVADYHASLIDDAMDRLKYEGI